MASAEGVRSIVCPQSSELKTVSIHDPAIDRILGKSNDPYKNWLCDEVPISSSHDLLHVFKVNSILGIIMLKKTVIVRY